MKLLGKRVGQDITNIKSCMQKNIQLCSTGGRSTMMTKLFYCFLFFVWALNASAQSIPKWKLNDLKAAIQNAEKPTIFNFWATFCKPCVAEIPYFQQLAKKYEKEGVQLILISLDLSEAYPKQISSFATKHKFTSPIKFLDETNADLFCPVV